MLPEETRQIRRARERREGVIRGTTSATKPLPTERRTIRAWHIAVGIPIAFVAIGSGLAAIGPAFFTMGVGLAFTGLTWLLFDWWLFSKDFALRPRLIGACGTLAIAGVLLWVTFRPAPLAIDLALMPDYPDGSIVGGLKWNSKNGGLELFLRNDSDFQYTDISFLIRTDLVIEEMGFVTKVSQCSGQPTLPGIVIEDMYLAGRDPKGNPINTPVGEFTQGDLFKVYCDKIVAHDRVRFVIATGPRPGVGGFKDPAAVSLRGSFIGYGQSRPLQKQACLIKGCSELPFP